MNKHVFYNLYRLHYLQRRYF